MVTPLRELDSLDRTGLERLVEHILEGGVSGLFILGSTGEAAGLSRRLQLELIQKVCERVGGRVPVLVGITDPCFTVSVELSYEAARAGATAVVAAPPYYYPLSQAELLGYLRRLAAELPLPLFLYNMPLFTKVGFDAETVARAAEIPNVVGFKDSSGSIEYFKEVCRLLDGRNEFSLLAGTEQFLVEAFKSGAHGAVTGGANLFPRLFVDLYDAATKGDEGETARLQRMVVELGNGVYRVSAAASSYLRGLKSALVCLGICSGFVAEPYESYGPGESAQVRRALEELGLLEKASFDR